MYRHNAICGIVAFNEEGTMSSSLVTTTGSGQDAIAPEERLLRAADVQAQLGMSRAKVYRLMQHNILPTVRIGGSVRVQRKALFRWIEENTMPGRRSSV
jgi:excisionase family DNA binding protein